MGSKPINESQIKKVLTRVLDCDFPFISVEEEQRTYSYMSCYTSSCFVETLGLLTPTFWKCRFSPGILFFSLQTETVSTNLNHFGYGGLAKFWNKDE